MTLSGNGYYRDIRTDTLNGDINEDSLDQSVYQPTAAEQAALAAAGYTGVPASRRQRRQHAVSVWRCIANVLLNDEPAETVQRPDQPRPDRSAQRRRCPGSSRCATRSPAQQSVHGWRRLRPQPRRLHSVDRARLPQSRSQRHRRRRVRRRRDRRRASTASRSTRASISTDTIHTWSVLRDRHAVARRSAGTSRSRAASTARRSTTAIASAGRRAGLARRRSRVQPIQPGGRRHVRPVAAPQPLCRLQRRQPRGDVDRARLRGSRSSRASCQTRWPAIRRSTRSSRGRSRPACAATRGGVSWNAGVFRARQR